MRKKMIVIVLMLIFLISIFSGCIYTIGWSHANEEGTSVTFVGKLGTFFNKRNWEVGFVYDKEFHPSWKNYENYIPADDYYIFKWFHATISDLERDESIHFRAIATWLVPDEKTIQSFDIEIKPGWPSVKTGEATNIELEGFTMNGHLIHMGGASECDVWFEYGESEENLDNVTSQFRLTSPDSFSETIDQLTTGKTYYYKAVAKNDIGTVDGRIESVTPGGPSVSTKQASDISTTTAVLNGKLYDMGGTDTCDVWFEYGTSGDNLDQTTEKITMDSAGDFQTPITELESYTTYYFQAVADNDLFTGRGTTLSFETDPAYIQVLAGNSFEEFSLKNIAEYMK